LVVVTDAPCMPGNPGKLASGRGPAPNACDGPYNWQRPGNCLRANYLSKHNRLGNGCDSSAERHESFGGSAVGSAKNARGRGEHRTTGEGRGGAIEAAARNETQAWTCDVKAQADCILLERRRQTTFLLVRRTGKLGRHRTSRIKTDPPCLCRLRRPHLYSPLRISGDPNDPNGV
jgi:hypothetical protein